MSLSSLCFAVLTLYDLDLGMLLGDGHLLLREEPARPRVVVPGVHAQLRGRRLGRLRLRRQLLGQGHYGALMAGFN